MLPRILFYFTILFALVGWGHKWLIAGALGASLVYSGQAAVHACLLAWSQRAYGENDLWALAAILGTSALMAVPLLNWSKSIRDLSLEKNDEGSRSGFSKARTIVIYWGFLVVVGLTSVLILISVSETSTGAGAGYTTFVGTALDEYISCTIPGPEPANTTFANHKLNIYAENGTRIAPVISNEWAAKYSCSDPCAAIATKKGTAIFRQSDDYELASDRSLSKIVLIENVTSAKDRLAADFQLIVRKAVVFVLPYVVSQGIWASAFGRRSPTQTRDALYLFLRNGHVPGRHLTTSRIGLHPRRKLMAKMIALCT